MKQKHFLYESALCTFSKLLFSECTFSLALLIPSKVPARNSTIYITVLVRWNILLYTVLHLHHSLFYMEQSQNLKGIKECSISKTAVNEAKVMLLKRRYRRGSSKSREPCQQKNKKQRTWRFYA